MPKAPVLDALLRASIWSANGCGIVGMGGGASLLKGIAIWPGRGGWPGVTNVHVPLGSMRMLLREARRASATEVLLERLLIIDSEGRCGRGATG